MSRCPWKRQKSGEHIYLEPHHQGRGRGVPGIRGCRGWAGMGKTHPTAPIRPSAWCWHGYHMGSGAPNDRSGASDIGCHHGSALSCHATSRGASGSQTHARPMALGAPGRHRGARARVAGQQGIAAGHSRPALGAMARDGAPQRRPKGVGRGARECPRRAGRRGQIARRVGRRGTTGGRLLVPCAGAMRRARPREGAQGRLYGPPRALDSDRGACHTSHRVTGATCLP